MADAKQSKNIANYDAQKPVYYILLNDRMTEKREKVHSSYASFDKKFVSVIKGEILKNDHLDDQAEEEALLRLSPIERPSLTLQCTKTEVQRLDQNEACLLLALPSLGERLRVLKDRNLLELGKKLDVGSKVWVKVSFGGQTVKKEFESVIRYKGPLGGLPGILFGVELVGAHSEGTTDGFFKGKRYFECPKDTGIFVSLEKLSTRENGTTDSWSEAKPSKDNSDDEHMEHKIEDPVWVFIKEKAQRGIIKYIGRPPGKKEVFAGIEMDAPCGVSNGEYYGRQLFLCPYGHAYFAEIDNVVSKEKFHRLFLQPEDGRTPDLKNQPPSEAVSSCNDIVQMESNFAKKSEKDVIKEQDELLRKAKAESQACREEEVNRDQEDVHWAKQMRGHVQELSIKRQTDEDEISYLNNICLTLGDAIKRGHEAFACDLVRQLSSRQASVKIMLDVPENKEINSVNVHFYLNSDGKAENENAGCHFTMDVSPHTTLRQLRQMAVQKRNRDIEKERQLKYEQMMMVFAKCLIENQEEFECPICFTDADSGQGVVLRECLHNFCRECLIEHIRHSSEAEVQCPFQGENFACREVITHQEIQQLLNEEDFQHYLYRSLTTAENQAPDSFHCQTPNCHGWCLYDDEVNIFDCLVCRARNCLTCKAIHHPKDCKEYQDDLRRTAENDDAVRKTNEYLEEMLKTKEGMNCPCCGIVLIKKEGCDWMKCTMCKTEICWATRGPRWGPGDLENIVQQEISPLNKSISLKKQQKMDCDIQGRGQLKCELRVASCELLV